MSGVKYLELMPGEELLPFVKCFWISVNDSDSELTFSTLPDGCLELVVSYDRRQFKSVRLFDILAEAYDHVVMPAGELKFGIRLKPLGKEYYLDKCTTLGHFAGYTQNLSGDLSNDLQNFAQQVSSNMLNLVRRQNIDKRKLLLFDLLEKTSGNVEVAAIAQSVFWSSRQINRYLNRQLGMPLKTYSNILKCYTSYSDIKSGYLNPGLGFYDQSHFIREIKKHTGTTPKVLFKNEGHQYLQFNDPVDEASKG